LQGQNECKITQPPSSDPEWFKERLAFHEIAMQGLQHTPSIPIPASALTVKKIETDLTTLLSVQSSVLTPERKRLAREFVSPNIDSSVSIYWYSADACNLFHPDKEEHVSVHTCLVQRIETLKQAINVSGGYSKVIEGGLTNEDISTYDIDKFKAKIRCLRKAYEFAIERMGSGVAGCTWVDCCTSAASSGQELGGTEYPKDECTIRRWNIEFRTHKFFLRNKHQFKGIPLPPFLLDNPDAVENIKKFVRENLDGLPLTLSIVTSMTK